MHYLVDAYNLLFRIQKKIPKLEECRKLLIEQINEAADRLSLTITLVFDGAEPHMPSPLRAHFDAIALVYTPEHQTADEYIIQEVTDSRHPAAITVVSNDRELIQKCRLHKAHTQTIETFFSQLIKKDKKQKKRQSAPGLFSESSHEFNRLLTIFELRVKEQKDDPHRRT